jgi:abortive infection bacteriophage resistance protein
MIYDKPPLSIDEQITRLQDRGLMIHDKERAERYLIHIGYYRLSSYLLVFEESSQDGSRTHKFKPDTTFDDIIDLYVFDRKLRVLVMEAIERIEVSVRSNWTHYLSLQANNSHAHLDRKCFANHWDHQKQLSKVAYEIKNSKEIFVTHYLKKYSEPFSPHVWGISETLSIGALSHWYANTKELKIKTLVARAVGVPAVDVMEGILHSLTLIRNIGAHHNRLWNRRMVKQLPNIKKLRSVLVYEKVYDSKQEKYQNQLRREIYNYLIIMGHIMTRISPKTTWIERLKEHVETRNNQQQIAMGFPEDWQKNKFWLEVANNASI